MLIEHQTDVEVDDALRLALALLDDVEGNSIDRFYQTAEIRDTYYKHMEVFRAGADFRERCVFGGNRVGKSTLGAYETALHLTGRYPDWWQGRRFDRPINAWACSVNRDQSRDVVQEKLCGPPHAVGTGMLRKQTIGDIRKRVGVPDAFDIVRVKHITGGTSTLQFKSYAEGREGFQGRKIEVIWLDEEPELPIFQECLLRTTSTGDHDPPGLLLFTMTPMKGLSDVASHFLSEDGRMTQVGEHYATQIGWDEIPHLSEKEKTELMSSMTKHEIDARTQGYPSLGAGAVWEYTEKEILQEAFEPPPYFLKGYGFDVGWNCTAAVFFAIDPDTKIMYVTAEYKQGQQEPATHATAIKQLAPNQFGAIDPASRGRSQKDGQQLRDEYSKLGLRLVDAENKVEAGVHRVQMLLATQKLRIFPHCTKLLAEMRKYQRNDLGKIIKKDDHLVDALRYACLTDGFARVAKPFHKPKVRRAMA